MEPGSAATEPRGAPQDEHALVLRARADPAAFGELYRRHVDGIHAFAYRRTRSREVAEDVTAATFESALRALAGFAAGERGIRPWLYRIAARELVDHYRREARPRSARGQRALGQLASAPVVDDVSGVEREPEVGAMLEALSELQPRYQAALSLRFLAGLDHADAAAALGCSKPALAVTVHRALGALRRAVERENDR